MIDITQIPGNESDDLLSNQNLKGSVTNSNTNDSHLLPTTFILLHIQMYGAI